MSRNYDNWERLVAAVLKREEIWELCHLPSRSPSICSEASSSDFSSSFRSTLGNSQGSSQFVSTESCVKIIGLLGKGRFGTSILIQLQQGVRISDQQVLPEGTQLVAKKLVGKVKETEQEFKKLLENCRHENVATPRAYYFCPKAIYIFNDYHSHGSLYDLLHGKRSSRPNWESCLKIAIGGARGISHIHGHYGGKMAHGNVKSSNIFLNSKQYGCVSDFGLGGLIKTPGKKLAAIYRAAYKVKNASHESDVYNFGVVLLELLTGKSLTEAQVDIWIKNLNRDELGLINLAFSMRADEWSSKFDQSLRSSDLSCQSSSGLFCDELDVFDSEMVSQREAKIKHEMVEMLHVARRCLFMLSDQRPKMFEVVLLLENINLSHNMNLRK